MCRSASVGFSVLQTSKNPKTLISLDFDLSTCSDLLPCDSTYKQGSVVIYNQILDTDYHILDVDCEPVFKWPNSLNSKFSCLKRSAHLSIGD